MPPVYLSAVNRYALSTLIQIRPALRLRGLGGAVRTTNRRSTMHDIDTIARNNEAAVGAAVRRARAQGLYVVQVSAGLNLVEYQAFRDPTTAEPRAAVLRAEHPEPVSSVRVLAP